MNGLLDFFNYKNSGLKEFADNGLSGLRNTMANTPKMYDPHANAQALMGGQAMQYNQQPQSLIGNTPQVNNPTTSNAPTNVTPQQTQQVTYGAPVGPNMGQVNTETSEVSSYDDSNGYDPTKVAQPNANYNNRINAPMHPSLLMGAPEVYEAPTGPREVGFTTQVDNEVNTGVISNPPEAQTTPFWDKYGWSEDSNGAHLTGELKEWAEENPSNLGTNMTDAEKAEFIQKREEAMARLPWYLGGTGGK